MSELSSDATAVKHFKWLVFQQAIAAWKSEITVVNEIMLLLHGN